jgi:class 3 adenylate cyclase
VHGSPRAARPIDAARSWISGDGVNVASRIRPLAEPGGVVVSEPVFDAVKGQAGLEHCER